MRIRIRIQLITLMQIRIRNTGCYIAKSWVKNTTQLRVQHVPEVPYSMQVEEGKYCAANTQTLLVRRKSEYRTVLTPPKNEKYQ
jgi:hypothetical protein